MSTMDISAENKEMQQDEKLAVSAIFGDSILTLDQHNSSRDQQVYLLSLNVDQGDCLKSPRTMVLRLFFPSTYPSHDLPVFEMTSVYCGNTKIDSHMVDAIQQGLYTLFQPGQVVLFEWIQWLEDYIRSHVKAPTIIQAAKEETMEHSTTATTHVMAEPSLKVLAPTIYSSPPLVDRKSIFVAHVANVKNVDQVKSVVATLLENKKIARATHNIMAYRILLQPSNCILQDNDDDGETAAGGRLMHLLQILDVKDVIVVVSRWFGGILLGPDRFKDINNCARQALEECGYLQHKKNGKQR